MYSDVEAPKRESTPTGSLSSIPHKRPLEEGHSPAVSSPLNAEVKPFEPQQPPEDASQPNRPKPSRAKKDTLKKREALAGDGHFAAPDPKSSREPEQSDSGPLRYKLAPPKTSDFELPRGPILTPHHEVAASDGRRIEFFETSEQYASVTKTRAHVGLVANPAKRL